MILLKMKCFLLKKIMVLFLIIKELEFQIKVILMIVYLQLMTRLNEELNFPNRKSGCAALDMAYVASGRYDGYFQNNLNLWDIAAGIILIKEAGGVINDIDLNNTKNIKVIASSANISAKFQEKLSKF